MQSKSQKKIATTLENLLQQFPEAGLVENRYRSLRVVLKKHWKFVETVDQKDMINFLKDVVYLDRRIRLATEGQQDELKQQLSEEKQLELGYAPHLPLKV